MSFNCGGGYEELSEVQAVPVKLKEKTLWIRTGIEEIGKPKIIKLGMILRYL